MVVKSASFVSSLCRFQFSWTDLPKFLHELDSLQRHLVDVDFRSFRIVCKAFLRICKSHSEILQRYDHIYESDQLSDFVRLAQETDLLDNRL